MKNKVEILTCGARRLVFVNGVQIGKVMRIETPKENGQTGPRVLLEFDAEVVTERAASEQEWNLMRAPGASLSRGVTSSAPEVVEVIRAQMQRGML